MRASTKPCSVEGCTRPFCAKGYCAPHYAQWRRRGDPSAPPLVARGAAAGDPLGVAVNRIVAGMVQVGECWKTSLTLDRDGYAKASVNRRNTRAHRITYEFFVAPIPDGLVIDHLCRNRWCVNPWHLDPVPNKVNILRGEGLAAKNARKTHCPRGHEYTPENTYLYENGRCCRMCSAIRAGYDGFKTRQTGAAPVTTEP